MNDRSSSHTPPWYADGLRFECLPDCGACCTNHDDYAYVYVEEEDVERLAAHLETSREAFLRRYTVLDDGDRVLRMDRPECPFLEGTRCSVYAARPVQCRTFPFWEENLISPRQWKRLGRFCPGIDRGPQHSTESIRRHLETRERAFGERETNDGANRPLHRR